ncbi:hypothetical protein AA313_de0206341 [Arthrobotrys entomopaga]|nr:hypothetical protein AA313_de0206341 [Arthrobotrys entomopaga]
MGPKSQDHPRGNGDAGDKKKRRPIEHTSPLWSSVWWKYRKDPVSQNTQTAGRNIIVKSSNTVRTNAIRDIDGKLCGVDLHTGFDVPPLEEKNKEAILVNEAPSWLEQEIRPLSIKRISTPKEPESPKSLSNPELFHARENRERDNNVTSSARTYSRSQYSTSQYSQASRKLLEEPLHTRESPFVHVGITLDTNVGEFQSEFAKLVYTSLPSTPNEIRGFRWSRDSIDSKRGIITDVDSFGNSIYEAPQGRVSSENAGLQDGAKASSLDRSASEKLITTNSSAFVMYNAEELDVESTEAPAPNSMLSIRRQFIKGLPDDDELSDLSSVLSVRNGSESFYSRNSSASDIPIYVDNLEATSPLVIHNCTEPGNLPSMKVLLPEIRVDGADDRPTESELINKVNSTEHRRPSIVDNCKSDASSENRFDTGTEGGKSLLAGSIGGLEPINAASLKRLPDISRRRLEQDVASRCETDNDRASNTGRLSTKGSKVEDEMMSLRQQATSALSQVTQFQAIINRTSQRYINAQYQNLELQRENTELNRQISDLRDHQRVIHEALDNAATKSVTDDVKLRRLAQLDKDNFHLSEENHRLRDQVKGLTQELAIDEEEKRILREELKKQTAAKEAERIVTSAKSNKMGSKWKWLRDVLG